MAERKPIVLIGGVLKELPSGDTVTGATGSPVASTWLTSLSATGAVFTDVCYGEQRFVAVGPAGAQYSEDGTAWTAADLPAGSWTGVAYGNGRYIAVSNGTIGYSTDGRRWGTLAISGNLVSVCYGDGKFVAVAVDGATWRGTYSYTGATWSTSNLSLSVAWSSVGFGAEMFVAAAASGTVAASSVSGISWIPRTTQSQNGTKAKVLFGNNRFMLLTLEGGSANTVQVSADMGTTWVSKTPVPGTGNIVACYGNGVFVAIRNGIAYTTADGEAWSQYSCPSTNGRGAVAYGNGMFVAMPLLSSPDNDVWLSGVRQDFQSYGYRTAVDIAPSDPITPQDECVRLFGKTLSGRIMAAAVGPSGMDYTFQPAVWRQKVARWNPPGNATTVPGVDGIAAPTALGTATARNVATTNLLTRTKRLAYVSAATAGSFAGHYSTAAQYTIGNGSGLGGFFYSCRFAITDAAAVTGARSFVGLTSSTATPTNVEPSTLLNCIGLAQLSTDATQLYLVYGGAVAQTPLALGTNFPPMAGTGATNGVLYDLSIFSPPGDSSTVYVRVERIGTSFVFEYQIYQIPVSTTLLAHRAWRTNNATALAVALDIVGFYIETDY